MAAPTNPWDQVPDVSAAPAATKSGWDAVPDVATLKAQPNADWQSQVTPVTTFNGKQSVQRSDGGVWYGPDQGNTGKPGWFDGHGNRLGDAPGQAPSVGVLGGIGIGLKRALANAGSGLANNVLRMTGESDLHPEQANEHQDAISAVNQGVLQERAQQQAQLNQSSRWAKIGAFGGEQAPAAVMASLAAPEAGGTGVLGFIGRSSAAASGVVHATVLNTPGDDRDRAIAGTTALVATPVFQAGGELAGWLGKKGLNALAGTGLGNRLGIKTMLNPKYAGAPELSSALDEAGITSHTVGDVTGDPIIRAREDALARNNPKMMDLRMKENQQAAAYGDRVVSDLRSTLKDTGWQNIDDLKAAVEDGGRRAPQAQALLNAIDNSGDDWKRIAQTSGNLNLMVKKLKADALYDKAEAIAGQYGPVVPKKLVGSLDANIRALGSDTAGDQSIIPYLQRIRAGLEDGTQPTDFASLRQMRSSLNDQLQSLTAPNSVVQNSNASRSALQNVTKALESDLDTYAKSHSSGLRNAWKEASSFYRDQVVPYKDAEVGKILADQDPLALGRLFQQKDPYSQQKLFDLVGAKGQAAIRLGLVDDALEAGEKTQRGAMGQTFGAANAAAKLEQLARKGTMDVAFPGGENNWAAAGLAKILRTVDRSDNVGFTPPTGVTAQSVGAKVEGNTTALGATLKGIDWLRRDSLMDLYSDPKGKALLIRANDLPVGSPALKNLISNQLPKVLGVSAGRMGYSKATATENPNDISNVAP